jgi:hypothetical protein
VEGGSSEVREFYDASVTHQVNLESRGLYLVYGGKVPDKYKIFGPLLETWQKQGSSSDVGMYEFSKKCLPVCDMIVGNVYLS